MTKFPTIDDVIEWLRNEEQPGMALAVQNLQERFIDSRNANEHNLAVLNALREKLQPTYRPARYRAPAESDG